jgi:hypothetical protein
MKTLRQNDAFLLIGPPREISLKPLSARSETNFCVRSDVVAVLFVRLWLKISAAIAVPKTLKIFVYK